VESGEAGVDDSWSTTTRYWMADGEDNVQVDLPAEMCDWYVVHPRIEDDHTFYIDAWQIPYRFSPTVAHSTARTDPPLRHRPRPLAILHIQDHLCR
jgi:hypothetical protein